MKLKHFALIISCSIFLSFNSFGQSTGSYVSDYETVLDLANLSARVYDNIWDAAMDALAPIFCPDIDYVGNTSHYEKVRYYHESGFYASLYRNVNTNQYVLSYRGTEALSFRDWLADLNQVLSDMLNIPTTQYTHAVNFAREVKEEFGAENVILTGHSLGGGLAQTAALANGLKAVCFEAAGITNNTLEEYEIDDTKLEINKQQILHVNVRWDPLSDFDGGKNAEAPFSNTIQYGAATVWLKALPGTSYTINPTRIANHFYPSFVAQLTNKKFLGSHVITNVKSVEGEIKTSNVELTLYPNPVSDMVTIMLNNNDASMVSVISMTGQVVKNTKYFEGETSVDVSDLPTGMYIVQVQNEHETIQQRFIKK
ncbi:MAG: T9SS type A sorting domain-containing protein [Bacteroidales bacterium]|nr:T9SS type A sorting domain-containing protein [Bacteroidales bacterium]